jgi:hypothetical protein
MSDLSMWRNQSGRAMARPLFLCLLALALLTACGSSEPGDDLSDSACLSAECQSQLDACRRVPACPTLVRCLETCSAADSTCRDACLTQYPDGTDEATRLFDCAEDECGN